MNTHIPLFLRRSFYRATIAVAGLTFVAAQSHAGVLFSYPNFSSTAGLTLVGTAATATTSDGTVLRLTTASGSESGAGYSTSAVPLGSGDTFSTQFQFRFTSPGGIDPADGITFVLAASPTGLGSSGAGIGYEGVPNSVAVEFDTYNNGSSDGNSSNHIGIDENGNLADLALANVYGVQTCNFSTANPNTAAGCMSNGDLWTALLSYNGSNLTVTVTDPKESSSFTAINNYSINLASFLGTSTAYVGFTAGTGSGYENHDIINWTFSNSATIGPSTVPEPSELTLIGAGLCLIGYIAHRRRSSKRTA